MTTLRNVSLCIPRVSSNTTKKDIENVINPLELGELRNIEILTKKNSKIINGETTSCVFIHFKKWYSTPNAIRAHNLLTNDKDIKVFYDEPWFWKIYVYKPLN